MGISLKNLKFRCYNRLKLLGSYIKREFINRGFPASISIEVTSRCNLSCRMCARSFEKPLNEEDIDFNIFKKVIKESKEKGTEVVLFSGYGEPLLHPRIIEMVDYCSSVGLKTHLATNATLLTEKIGEDLINAGLSFIILGVDGATKEVYEWYRWGAKYELVTDNIRNFLRIKTRLKSKIFVEIQMIKMKKNLEQISMFKKKWRISGIDAVRIKEDEIKREELSPYKLYGKRKNDLCVFPWLGPLFIGHNGSVIYHGWTQRAMDFNVKEKRLEDIWNSKEMQSFRSAHLECSLEAYPECFFCRAPRPCFPFSWASFLINNYLLRKYLHIIEYADQFLRIPIFSSKM